ncbi:phage major capsid protein, HK97 family [Anaerovibrio lipolyticus DSM 3074]|uniref:Phage major capsid protein, HK97 family n=1 Tax=Anaerovibrio lipolyticus DSM 3074 TaxID=1120997 RepID=A0A1M6G7Q3_9FIRM|nr:phage major capsid protein [Anaerovibrio lipolyticus]SHJ05944.1 phage major capsid protein, HK97 family [Anaerovibrio lipolyticus DSM 3074]
MNFKELIERRNELVETMDGIFKNAEVEKRALNEEENTKYDEIMQEIRDIDSTMKKAEEARNLDTVIAKETKADDTEERAFIDFIRSEKRELAAGDNGAIIPQSIADRIIENVRNIAPVFELATKYNAKGNLIFPVYDESENAVTTAYAQEFTALNSKSGKFTSIKLGGHLAGALVKISKSLINNAEFDLLSYVVAKMSESIARFLEAELLNGEGGEDKMTGVLNDTNTPVVEAAAASAVSADDLVKLQVEVPQVYQNSAVWIMSKNTLLAVRTLKDGENRYMLNEDISAPFGYSLLGKPVFISDNMPEIASKAKAVVYGDFSGIFVNVRPNVEIQVLSEKYADEHATGVVAWIEADSRVAEKQKLAVLKMA